MNNAFEELIKNVDKQLTTMSIAQLYVSKIETTELNDIYERHMSKINKDYINVSNYRFIAKLGNVVAIKDNKIVTIWDVEVNGIYEKMLKELRSAIKKSNIESIYLTNEQEKYKLDEKHVGKAFYHETDGYYIHNFPTIAKDGSIELYKDLKYVLDTFDLEIAKKLLSHVIDSNMKGSTEMQVYLTDFITIKRMYNNEESDQDKNIFLWKYINSHVVKIKKHVIGTILKDIENGKTIEDALSILS